MIDVHTGMSIPHSPDLDTLGVTRGDYAPERATELREHLREHIRPQFPEERLLDEFINLVGLMISGRAPEFRAIVALKGESGSGKGAVIRLLMAAFGDRALKLTESALSGFRKVHGLCRP